MRLDGATRIVGQVDGDVEALSSVASRLATVLSLSLSAEEGRRLRRDPTHSFEAYDAYLRGHELFAGTGDSTSLKLAIDFFARVITGRCPAICVSSETALSISFAF